MTSTKHTYQNDLSATESKWFAVLTRVKAEKMVACLLADRKISVYLPLQKITKVYTRKKRTSLIPLMYRYVFVHITQPQYVQVLETPHVEGFIRFNKNLLSIPDFEIEWLQRVTGEQADIALEHRPFSAGDKVRVVYGNLTGLVGKLIKSLGKNELLVELEHIGIGLRIQIDPSHLELMTPGKYKDSESTSKSRYSFV